MLFLSVYFLGGMVMIASKLRKMLVSLGKTDPLAQGDPCLLSRVSCGARMYINME